ncbi:MAG: regulatory protein GemA [Geobacteraceae bacterium]|nr:regulatory protein GemA [Geobacteraceae bacterium]
MGSPKFSRTRPASGKQIKAIHALKTAIGMDDSSYRLLLQEFAGITTSKALNMGQAEELIEDLKCKAGQQAWTRKEGGQHSDLAGRPGMATPAQLRMIEAIWKKVSRAEDTEARTKALRAFIQRIAKVSDLRFLDREGAGKIINALESMQTRVQQKNNGEE